MGEDIFTKPIGDVVERHLDYAEEINGQIIMYTLVKQSYSSKTFDNRFHVYPINIFKIYFYPLFILNTLFTFFKNKHYKIKFDLIYTQDPFILASTGFLFRFLYRIPVLVGNHSNFIDNKKWLSENKLFRVLNMLAKYNILKADSCRVINQNEKNIYLKYGVKNPIHIVNTPVNIQEYTFSSDELETIQEKFNGRKMIFWAGRAVKVKNLELWFEIAQELLHHRQDICFCLASDFQDAYFDMPSEVKKAGLQEFFFFPGFIDHRELAKYYSSAYIFLHTAHYEGFGKVFVEAMSYGLPVITSDTSGAQEVLEDQKTGFIVSGQKYNDFVRVLCTLIEDTQLYTEISQYNFNTSHKKFNRENNIHLLIQCWDHTIKEFNEHNIIAEATVE